MVSLTKLFVTGSQIRRGHHYIIFGARNMGMPRRIPQDQIAIHSALAELSPRFAPQVKCRRILGIRSRHAGNYFTGRMSEWQETNIPSTFRFQSIHWESGIASTSWMRHMIRATSNRMSRFNVPKIEHQRSVNRYGWMQTGSGGPSSVANTRNSRA